MKLNSVPGVLAVTFLVVSAGLFSGCALREQPGIMPETPPYVSEEGGFTGDAGDEVHYLLDILHSLRETGAGDDKLAEIAQREDALGYEAALLLAERYESRGGEAAVWYRRALSLYNCHLVRGSLAAYLARQDRYHEATDEYLALLPSAEALSALQALEAGSLAVTEALVQGGHWQTAVSYLQELPPAETAESAALAALYARSLAGLGQYKKALPWFEQAGSRELADRDLTWWHARSLEGAGREKEAKAIYEALGPAGAYRLGLLLEKEGQRLKAASAFTESREAFSRWRGARLYEDLGRQGAALPVYLSLAGEAGAYRDDAAYRAYVLLKGEGEQAEEMLRVLEEQPAWQARLGREPSFKVAADSPPEIPDFLLRSDALHAAGRPDLAAVELAIGTVAPGTVAMLALARRYLDSAEYHQAARWAARVLREEPTPEAYRLAYPRPFAGAVQAAAGEFDLDPLFIWAVMREESRFRPEVASRAGALGLMQVMPATGRDIAGRLRITITDRDLLDPVLNVRFGAFYLRAMLDMFGGDMDKALAAYNGGPGNTRKWSQAPLGSTSAGFPTAIAFFETREYITRVQNSYHTYRWFYGR
jgi:soluble lytic murein transglycosylase